MLDFFMLIFFIIFFLVFRIVFLWYWKVNIIVEELQKINLNLIKNNSLQNEKTIIKE